MGNHKLICTHRHQHFTISFFFLLISVSTQLIFIAEGRIMVSQGMNTEKAIMRAQIGSRPPRCERRCSSCGHCEAIQVPTNPQIKNGSNKNSTAVSTIANSRRDDNSNYKPMSWKCKCGNFIFNP